MQFKLIWFAQEGLDRSQCLEEGLSKGKYWSLIMKNIGRLFLWALRPRNQLAGVVRR